jgi:AcrR family transcriptional regulator
MATPSSASAPARPGPGRPPSGARERILAAALEVLKRDGYAGLTTAKVAAASGQNKALIGYHFGSKQGLVASVAEELRETVTAEVLSGLGEPRTASELVKALADGVWRVMERDEGLQRVYFDLASQSAVEADVQAIMRETKQGFRSTLRELLGAIEDGPAKRDLDAVATYLIAGIEGLALERLDGGQTPELERARRLFVRAATEAIRRPADSLG